MSSAQAVLVTGAAKRLGRDIALTLAGQGFDIALHYHTSRDAAEATQYEIMALGRTCTLFRRDLSNMDEIPALIGEVRKVMPECRHLVNNAAVFERGPLLETAEASYEHHMAVNLKAPVFLSQIFAHAAKKPASIVNILDSKITLSRHSYFFYLLSKKALAEFTRMAAAELAPKVRVNAVCPGAVMETSDGRFGKDYLTRMADQLPMGKNPSPLEVAQAVHLLITSESLTGQLLFVDGGMSSLTA